MRMNNKLAKITIYIIGAVFVVAGAVFAGSLTPPGGSITTNFLTIEDLYQKTLDFSYSTSTHDLSTTSAPTVGTMHTLEDVWNSMINISMPSPSEVATGTVYGPLVHPIIGTSMATLLVWDTTDEIGLTWDQAVAYCAGTSTDYGIVWRLPSIDEFNGKISEDPNYFPNNYYWSGVGVVGDASSSFAFATTTGAFSCNKNELNKYTRCVH